jgi:hypothetical protein
VLPRKRHDRRRVRDRPQRSIYELDASRYVEAAAASGAGEPNISGDWAVEQAVLTIPPSGGSGSLVPRSLREDFAAGKITLEQIRARSAAPARPTYTEAGQAAATAFRMWSPEDNPRLSCKPASIVFDWTFD